MFKAPANVRDSIGRLEGRRAENDDCTLHVRKSTAPGTAFPVTTTQWILPCKHYLVPYLPKSRTATYMYYICLSVLNSGEALKHLTMGVSLAKIQVIEITVVILNTEIPDACWWLKPPSAGLGLKRVLTLTLHNDGPCLREYYTQRNFSKFRNCSTPNSWRDFFRSFLTLRGCSKRPAGA